MFWIQTALKKGQPKPLPFCRLGGWLPPLTKKSAIGVDSHSQDGHSPVLGHGIIHCGRGLGTGLVRRGDNIVDGLVLRGRALDHGVVAVDVPLATASCAVKAPWTMSSSGCC